MILLRVERLVETGILSSLNHPGSCVLSLFSKSSAHSVVSTAPSKKRQSPPGCVLSSSKPNIFISRSQMTTRLVFLVGCIPTAHDIPHSHKPVSGSRCLQSRIAHLVRAVSSMARPLAAAILAGNKPSFNLPSPLITEFLSSTLST